MHYQELRVPISTQYRRSSYRRPLYCNTAYCNRWPRFLWLSGLLLASLIVGCSNVPVNLSASAASPTPASPAATTKAESAQDSATGTDVVKPNVVTPNVVKSKVVEPNVVKPNVVEPNVVKPNVVKPNVVSYDDYSDPLIYFNRAMFAFNDVTYRYLLIPLAKGYLKVVPKPIDQSIGNFFDNLKTPIYALNNLLQLEFAESGDNLLRFTINTTLGLAGLFDPANAWFELKRHEAHVEDTLAHYDAGYGVYLVLPLLGPADLRSGTSTLAELYLNPISLLLQEPDATYARSLDYLQEFAPTAEDYLVLRRNSDDPYLFFRNLYLQGVQRDAEFDAKQ